MTTLIFTIKPAPQPLDLSDDEMGLVHYYCCNEDLAWCGEDLSGAWESTPTTQDDVCVVCADLAPCASCLNARLA